MSRYIDEHMTRDSFGDVAFGYSRDKFNPNFIVPTLSIVDEDGSTLLHPGSGGIVPFIDEYMNNQSTGDDYSSMILYEIDDAQMSIDDAYENGYDKGAILGSDTATWPDDPVIKSNGAARLTVLKNMKLRQSMFIDVVSNDSHGKVKFGHAKDFIAPPLYTVGSGFGRIAKGLSTFNLFKIDKEKAIVAFDSNDNMSLVVNMNEVVDDFRGMITFEIIDSSLNVERVIKTVRVLVTENSSSIRYISLPDAMFIDRTVNADFGDIAEIIESKSDDPVYIDGETVCRGDNILVNKTSGSIRVLTDSGDSVALDPYGVAKVSSSTIESVTVYKQCFARPSSVNGNIEGELFKRRPLANMHSAGGFFGEDFSKMVTRVNSDSIDIVQGNGNRTFIGPFEISENIDEYEIVAFGDDVDSIHAIRFAGIDVYIDGNNVYAKESSELNFRKVCDGCQRDPDHGDFRDTVGSVVFSTNFIIRSGSVHPNKNFVYSVNYIVSRTAVTSYVYGDVFPIGFFRTERINTSECGNRGKYTLNDGITTAKNIYNPAEVTRIDSESFGELVVSNAANPDDDIIRYSHKAALGYYSDTPFVVESFGYVSRDSMLCVSNEHFLSRMVKESAVSDTRKRYDALSKRWNPPYRTMWVKITAVDTRESTLMIISEYDDEHANFLGAPTYGSGRGCRRKPVDINRVERDTSIFYIRQKWSDVTGTVDVNSINSDMLYQNKAVGREQNGVAGSLDARSANSIRGIYALIFSPQYDTFIRQTKILTEPAYIGLELMNYPDKKALVVPQVGAVVIVDSDIDLGDLGSYSYAPIINMFERGVKVSFENGYLNAVLKYDQARLNVFAQYSLHSSDGEVISESEITFPDISESFASTSRRWFETSKGIDMIGHRPEYLANFLVSTYGFVQNIAGIWDESSGIIINDQSVSFERVDKSAGFDIVSKVSGVEPMTYPSKYIAISMYYGNKPYDISDEMSFVLTVRVLLLGIGQDAIAEAEAAYESGDEKLANDIIVSNMISRSAFIDGFYRAHPTVYTRQGPWFPTVVSLTREELMLIGHLVKIKIKPRNRVVLDIDVAIGNRVEFNMPGRRLGEMYTAVDGYVTEEYALDYKATPIQRGQHSYIMKYDRHDAGNICLHREVSVDLDAYPARLSYPTNNAIRELISPIREDAHEKKMDARAVYARFDTRYIYESIKSYYDKFIEMPTAFTCDNVEEEAIFNTSYKIGDFRYKDKIISINGDDIFSENCIIKLSFDNDSDTEKELTITYGNNRTPARMGGGLGSIRLGDAYSLLKAGILELGANEEYAVGRTKDGLRLKNALIGE